MAELTVQQKAAVIDRGGRLLVSAAAGSGKTKVLVDRLMSYLLDPNDPADLDQFLIITYTKAAASELRGKIASKLSEHLAADPENRHLQRQMQRLYLTKISTVHSFCSDILREYAYLVDMPADFRVADENETKQLRDACMKKLLDEVYRDLNDPDLTAFIDSQGYGRNDNDVPEILLKVDESAKCHLQPQQWLDRCIQNTDTTGLTDVSQTIWGEYLLNDLKEYLRLQIKTLTYCVAQADRAGDMAKPADNLRETITQLENLCACSTWDEVFAKRKIEYSTLSFGRKIADADLAGKIKVVRNTCKAQVADRLSVFSAPSDVIFEDIERSAAAVRGIVKLVQAFDREFKRVKKMRRIVDFSDLEHCMLDLLTGKNRTTITAAATEIGSRYREIMVDEYQDSNAVQDAIFMALTEKRQNCFMVGDVKQSIYQFRLADPGIFIEKYSGYVPAEQARAGQGRKVMLSKNFRSGGAVLKGVNDVFRLCMSPSVGGLYYGKDEELNEGFPHVPLGEPEVELWAVSVRENTYAEEAAFVAKRIEELTDGTHFVREGDTLRPIVPGDIAILLRSPNVMGSYFQKALTQRGIRCASAGGQDLLQTRECAVLRSLLQVISNPRQDIPLIAALASPLFTVSADELAVIRAENKYCSVYDALLKSDLPKVRTFLEYLAIWRREARLRPLSQLLESVFRMTHMQSIYAVMDDGDARQKNLQAIYELAVQFESTGRRDLEQFLEHMDALEGKGLVAAGEQNNAGAVTIMSTHKSKGLEFPVVFVSGLSKKFSRESHKVRVLRDQKLGLGVMSVDERNRVRYPSISRHAIAARIMAEEVSEELRVLYVALTRARDRLIMTYADSKLDECISELAMRMDADSMELVMRDVVCPGEWVLMTALRRTEAGELFALGAKPSETQPGDPPWLIRVCEAPEEQGVGQEEQTAGKTLPSELSDEIRQRLSFRYPHGAAVSAPSKQTATQRKGREKDAEALENTHKHYENARIWRRSSFDSAKPDAAELGTATHAVMQHICYERCVDEQGVRNELDRLASEQFISKEYAEHIDCSAIADLFKTEVGKKLLSHPCVLREFKFSVLDDGVNLSPELAGEQILLQGVVDCAMIDDDGITVIDFKTDYVTDATLDDKLLQYRPQVKAYADAMQRIYQRPVKQSYLYFFRLCKFVSVT